jgi:hypothetical protein
MIDREPVDYSEVTPVGPRSPEVIRKVKVMFRKIAVALVAASVFTVPVLAQNNPLAGGSPSSNEEKANKPEKAEKPTESTEKTEKTEKTVTRHHHVARHHHHGTKAAKYGKAHSATAMSGKYAKPSNMAKAETRRIGHGKPLSKRTYGRAYKHIPSGTSH